MIGKLSTNRIPFVSGPETFTGTFQEYISECAGKIGSDVYYANYRYEACEGAIARSSWDDGHTFSGRQRSFRKARCKSHL